MKKKAPYSKRGTRLLPPFPVDEPVDRKSVAKVRAILRRCIQDWGVAMIILDPEGKTMAHKFTGGEVPPFWVGTYGKKFTTRILREDIEYHLRDIRKILGIREK